MNDQTAEKFEAAVRVAVAEAIKAVGLGNFKSCSFFLSNERAGKEEKKAA